MSRSPWAGSCTSRDPSAQVSKSLHNDSPDPSVSSPLSGQGPCPVFFVGPFALSRN
jgi:hypothetical protein